MEGIRIESLLHLAAWNRENERADTPRTPTKVAPLKEVLNHDRPQLVPLSSIAPQLTTVHTGKKPLQASLEYITDPQNALVLAPLGGSGSAAGIGGETRAHASSSRLPTLSTITNPPSKPVKSAVPLAEVLNEEDSRSPNLAPHQPASSRRSSVSSGNARKRRKLSNAAPVSLPTASVSAAGPGLTLPKPQPRVNKEGRRNRIPPVISGLHDPPEDAVLLPSIAASTVDRDWIGTLPSKASRRTQGERQHEPAVPIPETAEDETPRDKENLQPNSSTTEDVVSKPQELEKTPGSPVNATAKSKKRAKTSKGYRRWTEQEGEDLVAGVKNFGIGAWKRILNHPQYHFNDRTAVDLKDRFRRCFPEEYRKAGEQLADERATKDTDSPPVSVTKSTNGATAVSTEITTNSTTEAQEAQANKSSKKPGTKISEQVTSSSAEPAFERKIERRGRVKFTQEEDDAILRGFMKYGPKWHKIQSDPDLKLDNRSRTDLRDRFRNKYPEEFKAGGRKKPSTDENLTLVATEFSSNEKAKESETASSAPLLARKDTLTSEGADIPPTTTPADPAVVTSAAQTASRPAPILQALHSTSHLHLPTIDFDGFPDFEASDDIGHEPITLRRDIFDYVPPHTNSISQHGNQAAPALVNAVLDNSIAHSLDALHMNPLLMLRPIPSSSAVHPSLTNTAMSGMPL
ncbi:hypothetical protein NA57DRAFT_51524 [Rhizodiscina lignyota]|uniref:Myb-like domain-containing protein n=1 Tax=Rhizodiscina lignyota TaxID=1504668 RepID=A0A9P4IUV5_9PEZI|nr:hypothetical protein NA57DRAFT_51524 [Rhizodiscina lignyota]